MKSRQNADPLWLPRAVAAELTALSSRQFDEAIRPRLPREAQRGAGAKLRYHAPAVVAALVSYRLEQAAPPDDESDPLMKGGDSVALERYRMAKAQLAERDLAERDRNLVKGDAIVEALGPALSAMRGTGDRLARQFGNAAAEIFNEGVGEFEAAAAKLVAQQEPAVDPPPKPADATPSRRKPRP